MEDFTELHGVELHLYMYYMVHIKPYITHDLLHLTTYGDNTGLILCVHVLR